MMLCHIIPCFPPSERRESDRFLLADRCLRQVNMPILGPDAKSRLGHGDRHTVYRCGRKGASFVHMAAWPPQCFIQALRALVPRGRGIFFVCGVVCRASRTLFVVFRQKPFACVRIAPKNAQNEKQQRLWSARLSFLQSVLSFLLAPPYFFIHQCAWVYFTGLPSASFHPARAAWQVRMYLLSPALGAASAMDSYHATKQSPQSKSSESQQNWPAPIISAGAGTHAAGPALSSHKYTSP